MTLALSRCAMRWVCLATDHLLMGKYFTIQLDYPEAGTCLKCKFL